MAVAVSSGSYAAYDSGGLGAAMPQTISASATPSGSDRFLISAFAFSEASGNSVGETGLFLTGATYGGSNMTYIGEETASLYVVYSYGVTNPSTSTQTIAYTVDTDPTGGTTVLTALNYFAYATGVNQTTPVVSSNTALGNSTTISVNITGTSTNNKVVDNALMNRGGGTSTATVGANQTQNMNQLFGANASRSYGLISNETSAVGTITMSWSISSTAKPWGTVAYELGEAVAATTTRLLASLGVGT